MKNPVSEDLINFRNKNDKSEVIVPRIRRFSGTMTAKSNSSLIRFSRKLSIRQGFHPRLSSFLKRKLSFWLQKLSFLEIHCVNVRGLPLFIISH